MKNVQRTSRKYRKKIKVMESQEYQGLAVDGRLELIRSLIPLGLMHIEELLQEEVRKLAGERYSRGPNVRYGRNPGSVVLGGQRVAIDVPRLRNRQRGQEVPLSSYQALRGVGTIEEAALSRVLKGLSCRDYQSASQAIPEAFGLSGSSISRHFIKASAGKLKELQERDLKGYDIIALWLDGKSFSKDDLIIAAGLTMEGQKVILGFIESATENARVASDFLNQLMSRGLSVEQGLLVIVDGSKGLNTAVRNVFQKKAVIQRCQWHKRENVIDYMPKTEQSFIRGQLQRAYERPTYAEARRALLSIRKDLAERNLSAASSLDEGFEDTLTLHRLGVFPLLGRSLKTTNVIESINARIEGRCNKVDCWKNSSQRQRWLAATLLEIEPRFNRIKGYRHLYKLRSALKKELGLNELPLRKAA